MQRDEILREIDSDVLFVIRKQFNERKTEAW